MRTLPATLGLALSTFAGGAFAQLPTQPPSTAPAALFPPVPVPISTGPTQIVEPQYSEEARIAGLEGSVLVAGVITGDGTLANLHVTRPLGLGLDERALEAIEKWRFPGSVANSATQVAATYAVDFALPSKQSRWHLVGAEFNPPQGVSRPAFAKADYPVGVGIGVAAFDEGLLLEVIGRAASVTLSFDIDETGYPGNFLVLNASAQVWGPQAAMLVRDWRFHPGNRGGIPVSVPCTVKLLWGPEDFGASAIARQLDLLYPQPPTPRNEEGDKPRAMAAPKK